MDLLVIGAISWIGYDFARRGREVRDGEGAVGSDQARSPDSSRPPPPPIPDHREFRRIEQDAMNARWQTAFNSRGDLTGETVIAGPGLVPHFSSQRSQNTRDSVKQTRLELFTGVNSMSDSQTGNFVSKKEVGSLFSPADTSQSSFVNGAPPQTEEDRFSPFNPSMYRTSEKPLDPVRVGPGLGLDPDTPAEGGFHQFFRVVPDNVNAFRKNNLPGSFKTGSNPVQKRAVGPDAVPKDLPDRFYSDGDRPALPTKAIFDAAAVRSEHTAAATTRDAIGSTAYSGNPHAPRFSQRPTFALPNTRRDTDSYGTFNVAAGNPSRPGMAAGAYQTARFFSTDSLRETPAGNNGSAAGPFRRSAGSETRPGDGAVRQTMRETTQDTVAYSAGPSAAAWAKHAAVGGFRDGESVPYTHRGDGVVARLPGHGFGEIPGAPQGNHVPGKLTGRQTMTESDLTRPGVGKSIHNVPMSRADAESAETSDSREILVAADPRAGGPQRLNVRRDPANVVGDFTARDGETRGRVDNVGVIRQTGASRSSTHEVPNKLPEKNPWFVFDIYDTQRRQNELAPETAVADGVTFPAIF